MKGRYECVLTVLVFYVHAVKGYYGWCGPYDTFCLFSEGNETTVSNLLEAQLKCSEIKNDSWPVELGDERVKEVFIEFIQNHSISNVILNAYNRNGQWHWKRSNGSVQFGRKSSVINNIAFYGDNKSSFIYSVVCMTGCRANWTDIDQTSLDVLNMTQHPSIRTLEMCKEFCEKNIACLSIEWIQLWHDCYMNEFPFNASELVPMSLLSHHVVDRTVKSVDRCIDGGFLIWSSENQGRCSEVTILSEEYGSIHFGEGEINETKSSTSKCLESAHAKATGVCLNNSTGIFYWKILEFHCTTENRTTFSEVKKELSDLKDDFTTENFEKTVKKALDVVKNQLKDMSIDDVNTVTRFVEDASNVNKTISEKRAESLIEIMEVAMEAPAVAPNKTAVKHDKAVVKTQISLINTLESVVSKMDLDSSSYNKTFKKFRVEVYEQVEIENRNFTFNPLTSESDDTEKAKGQIEVIIPKEAFESAQNQKTGGKLRANFIIYNSTELFENPSQSESGKTEITKIASSVISGSIAGANITGLQKKIYLTFQVANVTESLKCVFADLSNDSWRWSDEGMETHKENDKGKVLCQSDHLTNFAVLAGYKDDKHSKALTYISIIGMVLSIICLSFLIFTQMFFKKFRKGQYQIALLNLSVSLIIVNLLIILGLDRIENKVVCGIVAALLHYFLLVSFAWMLIEAILQYYKFVKVFDVHVSSFVWKTVLPAWTLPALVVIMTAAIDHKQYSASKNYCWLAKEAFHYAFLLLLAFVVVANTFIFIRIIKGISCDRPKGMQTNQTKSRLVWLQVQAGICCFIVMGLTWCFALFAFGKAATVMHFLFAIFNSMQGCFVFILFCLREKPVRKAWYALLCQGKASKKLISSTDSQSSSSLGKFKRRIKREDNELSSSDFSGRKNTESTDAALSKI